MSKLKFVVGPAPVTARRPSSCTTPEKSRSPPPPPPPQLATRPATIPTITTVVFRMDALLWMDACTHHAGKTTPTYAHTHALSSGRVLTREARDSGRRQLAACAVISYERSRASCSNTCAVIINSSAAV